MRFKATYPFKIRTVICKVGRIELMWYWKLEDFVVNPTGLLLSVVQLHTVLEFSQQINAK